MAEPEPRLHPAGGRRSASPARSDRGVLAPRHRDRFARHETTAPTSVASTSATNATSIPTGSVTGSVCQRRGFTIQTLRPACSPPRMIIAKETPKKTFTRKDASLHRQDLRGAVRLSVTSRLTTERLRRAGAPGRSPPRSPPCTGSSAPTPTRRSGPPPTGRRRGVACCPRRRSPR